ncbi:MAG: O-succinylhomoserine sulfhydrylase [Gemmatimonadota bacterium]|nr:O-succinylhomoserine sulfhydrylase [Gemmatimonadota bacterium]
MSDWKVSPETAAIRTQAERTSQREHSVPLYLTSSYVFDSAEHARALFAEEVEGNVYSRYSNPNVDEFIRKLCLMEGAEAGVATASGMAAIFATFAALLSSGDHVVASRALFGSTHHLLTRVFSRWGIEHTYVDADASRADWEAAIRPETKILFVETPSNPGLALLDLEMLGGICRERGVILTVDNCFTTPYLQQPIRFGAEIVLHSATKFIDGQGRVLGGAILGSEARIAEIRSFARNTGPSLSAFNAWVLSKSLETLAVRMDRHAANALDFARALESSPDVERVLYPFLESHPQYELARRQMKAGGGIVAITVKGGLDRARRFIDSLELISHSPNLGDTRTIATHPSSTTHSKLTEEERQSVGIFPGLIRFSIGLEDVNDVIHDVTRALESSR